MKKLLFVLLASLFSLNVYAGGVYSKLFVNSVMNASPTTASGTAYVGNAESKWFWVVYDETEVGNSISAAVTAYVSYDNTNWLQATFYDYAGTTTMQTSETISADGRYYFYLDPNNRAPYVKILITATNTDADDNLTASCYMFTQQ